MELNDYTISDADKTVSSGETRPLTPNAEIVVDPARKELVEKWQKKIAQAEKYHSDVFKRMRYCLQLAKDGGEKEWVASGKYVVPIINRLVNQAVAALYAKNPQALVKRKKKMNFQLWDGKPESLQSALQGAQMGDMQSFQMLQEVAAAMQQNQMLDKLAQTMVLLWDYYTSEQEFGFKAQLKAMVRRTKVTGVGYVKLCFQRDLEARPEITAQISDMTSKIAQVEDALKDLQEGEFGNDFYEQSCEMEQLRLNLQDLQNQEMVLTREGPVFDFPKSDEILIDPQCRHLKTFAGAQWVAHKFEKTKEEIEEIYGVEIQTGAEDYKMPQELSSRTDKKDKREESTVRIYEIWDKRNRQVCVIAEGHPDFLREPSTPDVDIERFWTVFPLVFNEVEHDDEIYPPSDVWNARHIQNEYNRSREGLRQHRIANRPYYVYANGSMEEADLKKLSHHDDHEIIPINTLATGQSVEQVLQRGPNVPIDPNQYEVEMHFTDIMRSVGVQEANLGGTGSSTATESAIAEQSRSAGLSDQVDDLDDLLSSLAHATGQLMLKEIDKQTAIEIAGPGAVWPDSPMGRDELAKDLILDIKAGSSGRPNTAHQLANYERAMPFIAQLPGSSGIAPEVLREYLDLLDIDVEDKTLEGLPSIQALNSMMAKPAGPPGAMDGDQQAAGADPRSDPTQQGAAGADNAQQVAPSNNGQPGFTAQPGMMGQQSM